MENMRVEVYISDAPEFIAKLVREGVTFDATQKEDKVIIVFTGGF